MKKKIVSLILILLSVSLLVFLYFKSYKKIVKYFYPTDYKEIVLRYCEQYSVDPDVVFAVIKNESGFDPNAISSVGARGLMQLTEETYVWIGSKPEMAGTVSFDEMFDPETNIKFGVYLLKLAGESFESESAVYSSYHAGFSITREWLKDSRYSPDGKELTAVPYSDTENYIKKVKKSVQIYKKLYGGNYD